MKPGKKNLLEVKIAKESANKSINAAERKADWWLYGGIYRPVWLEVVPAVHMRHFILNADQHGKLQAAIEMEGDAKGYELSVSVRFIKGWKRHIHSRKTNLAFLIRLRIRTRNSWWKELDEHPTLVYRGPQSVRSQIGTERPRRENGAKP